MAKFFLKSIFLKLKKFYLYCVLFTLFLILVHVFNDPNRIKSSNEIKKLKIHTLKNHHDQALSDADTAGCVIPEMHLDIEGILNETALDKITCSKEKDWLYTFNGSIVIDQEVLKKYKEISCEVTYLLRINDFHQRKGKTIKFNTKSQGDSIKLEDDYFWSSCQTPSRKGYIWKNIHAGIHRKVPEQVHVHDKLNVLMFGFDSVSRLSFMRRLPNLYKYLTDDLDAIVLKTHNIVGDGTTQALLPMFSGFAEPELPETRRGKHKSTFVDVYPFIWKNYSENGYITAYTEDESTIGTFQYRLNGFKTEPTTHFMRPFHLAAESDYKKHLKYCLGSTPKIQVMLDWLRQIFDVYPKDPKFVFGFHSEYSHDYLTRLNLAEKPVINWLRKLVDDGILKNTLLIVMSDHGHRFASVRKTYQGKFEERLPFFSFIVPTNFRKKYPNAYENLKLNAERSLTTPFDIHQTFVNILNDLNQGSDATKLTNSSSNYVPGQLKRGLSLFEPIPNERTCDDAFIEPHWCACLNWIPVDENDDLAKKAAQATVKFINGLTSELRSDCVELSLAQIKRVQKLTPKKDFLKFSKSADRDGRVPDLTGKTNAEIYFEIQLMTSPNDAIYEATLKYREDKNQFEVKEKDISRINRYGTQAQCMAEKYPHLLKYCFCKDQNSKSVNPYFNVIIG